MANRGCMVSLGWLYLILVGSLGENRTFSMYVLEIAIVRFIEAPEDKRTRSACGVTGQPRDAKDTILSAVR